MSVAPVSTPRFCPPSTALPEPPSAPETPDTSAWPGAAPQRRSPLLPRPRAAARSLRSGGFATLEPSPVIQAPQPPTKPPREGPVKFSASEKQALLAPHLRACQDLTDRFMRPVSLKERLRGCFLPLRKGSDKEVLALARQIGEPLMATLSRRCRYDTGMAQEQITGLIADWLNARLDASPPASRRCWMRRLGMGSKGGGLSTAWRILHNERTLAACGARTSASTGASAALGVVNGILLASTGR